MRFWLKIIAAVLLVAAPVGAAPGKYVAEVNGSKISRAAAEKRLWTLYGSSITDELITAEVVAQTAKKLGVAVPPAELDRAFAELRAASGGDTVFAKALAERGVAEADVKTALGKQLLTAAVVKKVAGITVTDAAAEKFFKENADKFGSPASAKIRELFLADRRQADDMLAALNAGADFEKLARTRSADPAASATGGEMGYVPLARLMPQAAEAVSAAAVGAHTGVIDTGKGFSILLVEDKRPGVPAEFGTVKADVVRALEQAEIDKAAPAVLARLRADAKIKKFD